MHIVAFGWFYVVLLMALTETSVTAGVLTVVFYGLLPMALLLWLFGGRMRRHRKALSLEPSPNVEPEDRR